MLAANERKEFWKILKRQIRDIQDSEPESDSKESDSENYPDYISQSEEDTDSETQSQEESEEETDEETEEESWMLLKKNRRV